MTAIAPTKPHIRIAGSELAMALFLMAETMLFVGLISACAILRGSYPGVWPPPQQPRLPMALTLGNTAILLASGAVLAMGKRRRNVVVAAMLGAVFLAIQGLEWSRLISFGLGQDVGPYGAVFYSLIGIHALHVIGGLFALLWLWLAMRAQRDTTRACGMYWFFVVGVWPVLYVLVYV